MPPRVWCTCTKSCATKVRRAHRHCRPMTLRSEARPNAGVGRCGGAYVRLSACWELEHVHVIDVGRAVCVRLSVYWEVECVYVMHERGRERRVGCLLQIDGVSEHKHLARVREVHRGGGDVLEEFGIVSHELRLVLLLPRQLRARCRAARRQGL